MVDSNLREKTIAVASEFSRIKRSSFYECRTSSGTMIAPSFKRAKNVSRTSWPLKKSVAT
jgi:hypothetical protein